MKHRYTQTVEDTSVFIALQSVSNSSVNVKKTYLNEKQLVKDGCCARAQTLAATSLDSGKRIKKDQGRVALLFNFYLLDLCTFGCTAHQNVFL